jgi:putative hydrolase of the HAD superfamily
VGITTVLLDAGGVILDESEADRVWGDVLIGVIGTVVPGYDLAQYEADVAEMVAAFSPTLSRYLLWKHTKPNRGQYDELWAAYIEAWSRQQPPLELMAGIDEEIEALHEDFKLVVAGQYGGKLLELLDAHGLLGCFASRLTQDDFEITKPDPRYLERIARAVGAEPNECLMVGDRIDNDVVPAKLLGMKTIRIRVGLHRHQEARTPNELPDAELDGVRGLAATVRAIAAAS